MKKILFLLLFPFSLLAQDGVLKTLVAGGVADAYTISEALPSAYDQKERFQVIFPFNNTGIATLKRAGLAIKTIKKNDGSNLSANDIVAGVPYFISYNSLSAVYQCETCGTGSSGGGIWGSITGTLSNQTDLQTALNAKLSTTLTAGHIFVGNVSNVATDVALSGDAILSTSGSITITKINGTSLSGLATGLLKNTTITGVPSIATSGVDYEVPLTFSTGLTRTTNTITVNTSQNIAKLSNLTTNGFVKTGSGDGTLSIDNSTYLTGNQTITLSGDISGSGSTAITTAIGSGKVTNTMLAGSIAASKLVGTDIATVGTITSGVWNGTAITDGNLATSYIKSDGTRAFAGDQSFGGFKATNVKELDIAGTAGNGFINFVAQSSNASAPSATGFNLFAGSTGNLRWAKKNGTDTYVRGLIGTLTADRDYTLPDVAGTIHLIDGGQTITSSIWNGTKISEAYGGTNQSTYATGDILYASASNTLSKLSVGSSNQVLTVSGGVPTWSTVTPYTFNVSMATAGFNPGDGNNYFFGIMPSTSALTTSTNANRFKFFESCTIVAAFVNANCSAGTNENWSLYIRVNDTTDNLVATTASGANTEWSNSSLSISISANDFIEMKIVCPTWSTNPTGCRIGGYVRAK